MRLLCLSNGHGEDEIAVRILRELQQHPTPIHLSALPLVGEGRAYQQVGIPLIGTTKAMPSGGFIYMDGRQLARDIQGGLLQLTRMQINAIRRWAKAEPADRPTHASFILAVGDIVPLLFAWVSGLPYAFVGTAKSEYYLRDERGLLPRQSWFDDRLERWTGCIYHPWERWLMTRPRCKAVFPRDRITASILKRFSVPAFDLGNPMMDGLAWQADKAGRTEISHRQDNPEALTIALLPGSRPPEAYANWETLLLAVNDLIAEMPRSLVFLAAIAPTLDLTELHQALMQFRWQQMEAGTYVIGVGEQKTVLRLMPNQFAECLHRADLAIAMAGTATEQFVGMGKPAITIPGQGPQFTPAFAEAQTRLLGPAVTLVHEPNQTAAAIRFLLQDPDRLHLIVEDGQRRMGTPGAAQRIAACLMEQLQPQA